MNKLNENVSQMVANGKVCICRANIYTKISMQEKIIENAKRILQDADSGSNDCKWYNDGFLDGIRYAIEALHIHGVVGRSEQLVICKKCGSSEMYQYTKTKDKCEECGNIQDY